MEFFRGTHIDFIGKAKAVFTFSTAFIILGLVAIWTTGGIQFGIDFTGGTEVNIQYTEGALEVEDLRNVLNDAGVEGAEIKEFGSGNQYILRVPTEINGKAASDEVVRIASEAFPNAGIDLRGSETFEGKVGEEMQMNALVAVICSVFVILLYVAFRFEFTFGLGAVLALVHDILAALIIVVLFNAAGIINLEMNQNMIAAFLAVLGFSINNTVIIFDRIRENTENLKGKAFSELANLSINETLSRTVNTFITTTLALVTIVLFGGEVLQGFAFAMLAGFVAGTYSSLFLSSNFVNWYVNRKTAAARA